MKLSSRKQKGKQFENYVANTFHRLLYSINKHYRQYIDQYTGMSVVLEQIKANRNKTSGSALNEIGDIYIPVPIMSYMLDVYNALMFIECKKWKQIDFRNLFQSLNTIVNIVKTDIIQTYHSILKTYPNLPSKVMYILALLVFAQHKDRKLFTTPIVFDIQDRSNDNITIISKHNTLLPEYAHYIKYTKDKIEIRVYTFTDYIGTILSAT